MVKKKVAVAPKAPAPGKLHIIEPGEKGMAWSARGGDDDCRPDLRVYGDKTPGKPGRPSSRDIFIKEARDRLRRGDLPRQQSLAAFCRKLLEWFDRTHPALDTLNCRSLQNILRAMWREHMH